MCFVSGVGVRGVGVSGVGEESGMREEVPDIAPARGQYFAHTWLK